MPLVSIVIGSKTDEPLIKPTLEILEQLKIEHELLVMSAHRNPEKVREFGKKAREQGTEVIIAAAGAAAHLPGVLASWTTLPVIGVPLPTSELKGVDSLYSIVQMPTGVPVACMSIGTSGAKNAALLAAQILGLRHETIREAYTKYKEQLADK
ncbi:MAG: 5-(carboxyamino)imidazole ribonucleotide mutase [Chloroflexi bacterium]|nr:5-(carboxyamino)imidazole ribonucleotide mutase [Chloroflexota bacterium]MBM3153702.1 5-(carboxyamino)imidazole ribonucleotide mutase [Chloroflexota bacterium]MBM3174185.1 5-(carboxyamino)imidazole ribonucleotide mutase [Chloroflexota bacterium]MBM4449818.1 5-(carboxyamino)imidazole ribonucleotide mutase [Chloroflexota bacterium]